MSIKDEILNQDQSISQSEEGRVIDSTRAGKKPFVEPEISVPVDVLEATTFFQVATSGATN